MRNFLLGALIAAFIAVGISYFINQATSQKTELESSDLILDQIKNVGKLVVTEGHFSEVITYKDAKKYYLDILTAEKKAIVVVNAGVTVSYDLSKIKHQIDQTNKTLTITSIPEAEININPNIKYHDLEEDFFNQFSPEDHNLIQKEVTRQLNKKIEASTLKSNAENRLISELQKIYILTNSLGWKLVYKGSSITDSEQLIL
ncbi:DUF4230 domain-containing protein [Aquimarina sp. MMG015]|uniref:DUF4230 domain-containing protein n=1 Tax=unclassified Aquimarina TaxID=2627091 RepID=UPI000E4A6978|nr:MULTISPECIES: DUF4230 domain-containing protein [unclassified Aquimarina]AXT56597.1 DUF4230 domain-containing protein [Aquimarina sp. AD1]MBQ4802605.1 DUF4230 domain-containing protein [Aquimarina sp. MMG015]RKN33798.1 DUF4230 domain-containing protein [Aquimarina sp. AD1]